ncbi:MAG: HGGxSTG domain-containing protein [Hyphomicrobium sp.]|jgi:hypothetical protein
MTDGYLSRDRARINQVQRQRRARNPRIDYYPSPDALMLINAKRGRSYPLNIVSGVLDAIVTEWADLAGIKWRKVEKPMSSAKRPEFSDHYARANESGRSGELRLAAEAPADFGSESGINSYIAQAHAREQASVEVFLAARMEARNRALAESKTYQAECLAELKATQRITCGAKTKSGHPCRGKSLPGKRRCKWHGGCSTGPSSADGKAKALANLKQFRPMA